MTHTSMRMSHVTHICMSHVSRITVMNRHVTYMNESCYIYEWVLSHIWMSHVTHMNKWRESSHTYEYICICDMTRIYICDMTIYMWHDYIHIRDMTHTRHFTGINGSCHTYEWVTSHTWMSHVTRTNESHHTYTYKWVLSHIWMNHVTHMNESDHITHVTYAYMSHVAHRSYRVISHHTCHTCIHVHINESYHTYEWIMSHMWSQGHRSTPSRLVIWISHAAHMNESCHTYECVMPHVTMRHGTHINWSRHTYECVMSRIQISHTIHMHTKSHVTHINESCHTCKWVTPHMYIQGARRRYWREPHAI